MLLKQLNKLSQLVNLVREGINYGLTIGGIIIFLIVIGLPARPESGTGLTALAVPLFVILTIVFGVLLVNRIRQTATWPRLVANGVVYGLVTAVILISFMSQINSWQANRRINLQLYLVNVKPSTTENLSGVPGNQLFSNPQRDPITQEYPEDAKLRTNPVPLRINNDEIKVLNFGLFSLGGIVGLGLGLWLIGLLAVVSYRLSLYIDWEAVRQRRDKFLQQGWVGEGLHWFRLLLPLFLFALFFASITISYDTPFWRNMLGDSRIDEMVGRRSAIINFNNLLDLSLRGTQNAQLVVSFACIIAFMVALRNTRYQPSPLPYIVRLLTLLSVVWLIVGVAVWRIQADRIYFIFPTLGFLPSAEDTSLSVIVLLGFILTIYVVVACNDKNTFEQTLVGVSAIAMLLIMPLFMDQYQTGVVNLVAINAMMGLGLNIVVGYAGLLDLGYVAFFAIGAYTYALIDSDQKALPSSTANDILYTLLTAIIFVPIIVFIASTLWQRLRPDTAEEAQIGWDVDAGFATATGMYRLERKPLEQTPMWSGGPPVYVSVGLLIFAVVATFAIKAVLDQLEFFDSFGTASTFAVASIMALLVSAMAGILLGFPVLRLRSDYLAIVTLGFGEIISDSIRNLENITGGTFGANQIPKPLPQSTELGAITVSDANRTILYLAIVGCFVVALLSMRLRASRLGRAWTALRSDEDIAQAMGINLVNAKLLAFSIGASFAGMAGLLFSARQTNIRPQDFSLDTSIEVLSLVIIGGMGSIPGVVVGAIALIGLPEMLRPLQQYRLLVFGALLVTMMLIRPEGLMPKPLVSMEERAKAIRAKYRKQTSSGKGA